MLAHLAPIIRVVWADGRVREREHNLVLQTARALGLPEDGFATDELNRLLQRRPNEEFFENTFRLLRPTMQNLPSDARRRREADLTSICVLMAEASGEVSDLLGGTRTSQRELEAIKEVIAKLFGAETLEHSSKLPKDQAAANDDVAAPNAAELGFAQETGTIIYLLPLVQTAWAEGRVTRRERKLILSAAAARGIGEDSDAYKKLAYLLETKPPEEFFERASNTLRAALSDLPPELRRVEERILLKLCAEVAEASGPGLDWPGFSGGSSTEEKAAIERIRGAISNKAAELSLGDCRLSTNAK
ncbi:MAG: hypothetical protein ACT4OT_18555 [Acidobacteriota bacterium]